MSNYKVIAFITILLIGIFLWLYVGELPWFSNTFNSGALVKWALGLGALMGIGLAFWLSKTATETDEKIQIWSICIICSMVAMPLFASLSNRLLSVQTETPVTFMKEDPYTSNRFGVIKGQALVPDGYYVFILKNEIVERFKLKKSYFQKITPNSPLQLPIRRGLWGFDVVDVEKIMLENEQTDL